MRDAAGRTIWSATVVYGLALFLFGSGPEASPTPQGPQGQIARGQSPSEVDLASAGCKTCHVTTDEPSMHPTGTVALGCTSCHGGNPQAAISPGMAPGSAEYEGVKDTAHPKPAQPDLWKSAANPVRAYTEWLDETQEYIQFVNPGDRDTRGADGLDERVGQPLRQLMERHEASGHARAGNLTVTPDIAEVDSTHAEAPWPDRTEALEHRE